MAGHVRADGHEFAYLVHVINQPDTDSRHLVVNVTDGTTGWFQAHNAFFSPDDFHWSSAGLDIRTPSLTWAGDAARQTISTTTPWGALDIVLEAQGPVLYYGGTGAFGLLNLTQVQYALPQLATTGTLTAEGHTWQVTGDSWLDRQWGAVPDLRVNRWSWMNLVIPGGDKIAIWDIRSADGKGPEESWATILRTDGTHELVPVTPLARNAGRLFTSPTSGFVFPTQWTLTIPSRDTRLTVTTTVVNQETPGLGTSVYEGAATFDGTYRGEPVSGRTYVEQLGNWTV